MKNIKLVLCFCLIFITIILLYFFISNNLFKRINNLSMESNENTFEKIEKDGVRIFLVYKEPRYSFGSGHKYLYVFSKNKLLLGMCKFGEFPLTIKELSKNKIFLKVNNFSNIDYVVSWEKKNKKIWKYEIVYSQNF